MHCCGRRFRFRTGLAEPADVLPSNNANIWPLKGGSWIEDAQTSAIFDGDYFILGSAVGGCLSEARAQIEATGYDDLNRIKCNNRGVGSSYWPKENYRFGFRPSIRPVSRGAPYPL